jgi:hypothetical protein
MKIKAESRWINIVKITCIKYGIPIFMKNNLSKVVTKLIQEDFDSIK